MKIVELTKNQYDEYSKYHALTNYCQDSKYALVMTNAGYSYDYIGYIDDSSTIVAASLILTKKSQGKFLYGYAPKGFLVNYFDHDLITNFLTDLRKYYKRQDFVFIKFNPEIILSTLDYKHDFAEKVLVSPNVINDLKACHVLKRSELQEFQLLEPQVTGLINLKKYSIHTIHRDFRKKIRKCETKGMRLTTGGSKDIDLFYEMIRGKNKHSIQYYRDFYNIYSKENAIDLIFIQIDYQKYMASANEMYENEIQKNDYLNLQFLGGNAKVYNQKINSDKRLQSYKDDIIKATEGLKNTPSAIIAGALVMKHYNKITIFASGYKQEFKHLNPNHYLHHAIMERYKPYFEVCDLNGLSGNWDQKSEYYGLNQFKLKFNPILVKEIGEFDLVCNDHQHHKLMQTCFIEEEFEKFHQ